MVFAEGARPAPQLWGAWDTLGLTADGVRLVGWWAEAPLVRVANATDTVFVSAYARPAPRTGAAAPAGGGGVVVAVASWDNAKATTVALELDWAALGLSPASVTMRAPALDGLQPELTLDPAAPVLTLPPAKGWLIDVRPRPAVAQM